MAKGNPLQEQLLKAGLVKKSKVSEVAREQHLAKHVRASSGPSEIALEAERNWALPSGERKEIVPGASHFAALSIAQPSWRNAYQVATIGDHTFLKVQRLKPKG